MIFKVVKIGVISAVGVAVGAGILFGTDAASYLFSSVRCVRNEVKDQVPVEFELKRAHGMLEEIIPEMQANIRLIAQEEVEIAQLRREIERAEASLADEATRIARLRDALGTQQVSYTMGRFDYTRDEIKQELARRFDHYKEAEVVLAGKQRLVETREKSLRAATQMLDRTRAEKVRLEDQIAALESQHRLVQAAATGSRVQIDNSKLAQTEKLLSQIKKRLDVAERVLAHEARFVQPIEIDTISEQDLLSEVDAHFAPAEAMGMVEQDDQEDATGDEAEPLALSRNGPQVSGVN